MKLFSHTSMSLWRRCRQAYYWKYVEGYTTPQSLGQLRGDAGHQALRFWYESANRTKNPVVVYQECVSLVDKVYKEFEQKTGKSYGDDFDLLITVLKRYFYYSLRNDNFEFLTGEAKFEIPLTDEYGIQGYVDGVIKQGSSVFLLENKFNKRAETSHIDLDAQISIYMIGMQKYDPTGVMYNIIRVGEGGKAESDPVLRKNVFRNPKGLKIILQEIEIQCEEMFKFHQEGGSVYRNPTGNCSWDCSFYPVCLSITDNGDSSPIKSFLKYEKKEEKDDTE